MQARHDGLRTSFILLTLGAAIWQQSVTAAPAPPHGIIGAKIDVTINSFDNDTNSVTLTTPYKIGDFRIAPDGSNNGDYDTRIGSDPTNNVPDGILITSVRENGRDDGNILFPGTNFCTSHIDYHRPGATNTAGELIENSYWIPIALTEPNSLTTSVKEWDINVAAAWFPYANYIGGFARNLAGDNGGALDLLSGPSSLVLGTNFKDLGSGKAVVDLTSMGIDSRTDGVLLVMGAKNEDNYALSQANTNDGTWNLWSKDNGTDGGSTEQDPLAFVFIPKTDTNIISGRFLGNGTIDMFSGNSPQFTITNIDVGTWELKIPGHSPRFGILLLSPEGGLPGNQDNIVTYQVNDAGDGWIIQSRDLPSQPNTVDFSPPFYPPPLETPGDGTEPVADFAFIPGATPGFVVTPTNNLYTTEGGDSAEFTVVLEAPPTSDVTIGVASDDTTEGTVSPSSLTFTPENWNVPQAVTVTGVDDAEGDGPVAYHAVLSAATSFDNAYNGLDPADVTVINLDNESLFTVLPISGLTTTEAGGTATFTVQLNTAPTDDVTIGLSSSDSTEGSVSPSNLTFSTGNWSQPQTVTVNGVDDFVDDGDVAYTIITAPAVSTDSTFNGQNPPDVSVVNMDDDTAAINLNSSSVSVVEGKNVTYTVALGSQPSADVTVNLASSDTAQGGTLTPSSLTFSAGNWNTPQTVTVTAADDLSLDGDTAWTITNSVSSGDSLYAALSPTLMSATTLDNEAALTLTSGGAVYGVGMPGVGIDGRATITDPNTPDYNGVTLTVTVVTNGDAADVLEVRNTGTGPGQIGVSGGNVTYGGVVIGTRSGGSGLAPLVINFNNAAAAEAAQALVRNVTFRNTNAISPSLATRTVAVALTHADGGVSRVLAGVRVGLLRISDFQDGADRGYGVYTNEADIELFESYSALAWAAGHSGSANDPRMWVDARAAGVGEEAQVLMRFDEIIGDGLGQIPTNATIVSAELMLNVEDKGDGSPLFRMLIPWDADFSTWDSMGGGVHPDDFTARSTYDSQIGVLQVSGDTGAGQIVVGVTADIQAWVNGEMNYGWAMSSWDQDLNSGWSRGTDGMAFSPSETPNIDNRPRLRVLWIPNDTAAASFRQGVNNYTGAKDTRIRARATGGDNDADFSAVNTVFVDYAVDSGGENDEQVLIRFEDIIGTNPEQVPPGSRIDAAFLDLGTLGGNAYGDGGQFFAMLMPWEDTNSWNSLGGGVQADGVKAAATPTASAGSLALDPNVCGGYLSFEVTADVQTWASGVRPNYGWVILPWPNGGDGWGIATSEATAERDRPRLRVYYTPPVIINSFVRTSSSATLIFSGVAGNTYTVQRADSAAGPFTGIGTATVQPDGTATFIDNSPLPDEGFYRVSYP